MSCLKQVIEIVDLLDDPNINGQKVKAYLNSVGVNTIETETIIGTKGKTDCIKMILPGIEGKIMGGEAPTLGIIGELGGIGARPALTGMVSDADGALIALACAKKLGISSQRGDKLMGDVIITTHIVPDAPIKPHKPVPFMSSPVDIMDIIQYLVDPRMDALLSADTTKGNRVIKVPNFAITPTIKDGWILRVSDDLIDIYERVTGDIAAVVPITMQDIVPYTTNVYHINSLVQPWIMSNAPLVGVATTAKIPVPGCGTGANNVLGLEQATRFCIEVAKDFTRGICQFYNKQELEILITTHGEMGEIFRKNRG